MLPYLHYLFDFTQILDFAESYNPNSRGYGSGFHSLFIFRVKDYNATENPFIYHSNQPYNTVTSAKDKSLIIIP